MSELLNDTNLNSIILFDNIENKVKKMREWKLLSPKSKEVKEIYYKTDTNTNVCELLGYFSKKTNPDCLSEFYETIVIKIDNKIIKIAPGYLLEMQSKDFTTSIGEISE